jgi:hypothetical protein
MPKVSLEQYVQETYDPALFREIIRLLEDAHNRRFEGRIYERYSASAAPTGTTISWQVGDQVFNSNPVELGTAGDVYIIIGWICIAAGAPGTWSEMRVLTGN